MALVLLADDDAGVLDSLRLLLTAHGHAVVLARSAEEALEVLRSRPIELVVTDIRMPGNERLEMLSENLDLFGQLPILVITAHPTLETAVSAVRLPVVDYLVKPLDPVEFVERFERALARFAPAAAATGAASSASRLAGLDPSERALLSPREVEILVELAQGSPPPDIADRLGISHHTVRNHLKSIYQKLGVGSQVELMSRLLAGRG